MHSPRFGMIGSPIRTARVSALFEAVAAENIEETMRLIKKDRSIVKKKNSESQTVLHTASQIGNVEITKILLEKGKSILNVPDTHGMTPIHIAAQQTNFEQCHLLINARADLNAVNNKGETILHILASLSNPDPKQFHKILSALIQNGADMSARDYQGNTPAHTAAMVGNEQVILFYKSHKDILDSTNKNNLTPLQVSAHASKTAMVALLLSMEVNSIEFQKDCDKGFLSSDLTEKYSNSEAKLKSKRPRSEVYLDLTLPLATLPQSQPSRSKRKSLKWSKNSAIVSESEQIAWIDNFNKAITLNQETKVFAKKEYRQFLHRQGTNGRIPLNVAAQFGHLDTVVLLVHKLKINSNTIDSTGKTPLLLSAKFGKLIVLEFLISVPSTDVLACSLGNAKNTLHYLVQQTISDIDLVLRIFKKCVDSGIDVNSKTRKQGYTPAHIAAISNNVEAIKLLHFIRADLQMPCLNGMSPAEMAAQFGHLGVLKVLLQLGVNRNNLLTAIKANEYSERVQSLVENTAVLPPQDLRTAVQFDMNSITHKSSPFEEQSVTPRNLGATKVTSEMFTAQNHPIHGLIARHTKTQDLQRFIRREGTDILCIPNMSGQISLHIAAQLKFYDIIVMLVEKYHVPLDRKCDEGNTALHLAAGNSDVKSCEFLIANGANVNILNNHGNFLHVLSEQSRDRGQASALADVIRLAVSKGLQIDAFNSEGFTPLHVAAHSGNTTIMPILLEHSARIDVLSIREQFTPLQIAAFASQKSAVRFLRSRGASIQVFTEQDFHVMDNDIINVLEIIQPKSGHALEISQFHSAICTGNKIETKRLLKKDSSLLASTDDNGSSPLHLATSVGDIEAIELFIDRGSNINALNTAGLSPIFVAARNGSLQIISILLKRGADVTRVLSGSQNTVLHVLGEQKLRESINQDVLHELVKEIVQKGVSLNAQNVNGDTALHIACAADNTQLIRTFCTLRANPSVYNHLGDIPLYIAIRHESLSNVKILVENNSSVDYLEWEIKQGGVSTPIFDFLYSHGIDVRRHAEKMKNIDFPKVHHKLTRLIKSTEALKHKTVKSVLPIPEEFDDRPLVLIDNELGIDKEWRELYEQCCTWRGLEIGKLDQRGVSVMFQHLQIPITSSELSFFSKKLNSDSFTLEQLVESFGLAWSLFQGEITLPSLVSSAPTQPDEQILSPRFSLPRSPRNEALSDLPSQILRHTQSDATADRVSEVSLDLLAHMKKEEPIVPNLTFDVLNNNSIPESYSSDNENIRKRKPRLRISGGESKPRNSPLRSSLKPRRIVARSGTDPDPGRIKSPREMRVETESQQLLIDLQRKAATDSQSESNENRSYQLYARMYQQILKAEHATLMTPSMITTYFKDTSCTKLLSGRVIPTIMQQTSNAGTITEESFCNFFLSQKALFHLMEVISRMQDTTDTYLKELEASYKSYSSTERFKVRTHLNEISKILDDISIRVDQFILSNTLVDSVDPLDSALQALRKRIVSDKKTISMLATPRKTTEFSIDASKKTKKSKKRLYAVLRTVLFEKESSLKRCQVGLNAYVTYSGITSGCKSSCFTREPGTKITISQVWRDAESLKLHTESNEFKAYQNLLMENELDETVSIQQIKSL